jgi:exosortase A-associated hydrolase 1
MEEIIRFNAAGKDLYGILHHPESPSHPGSALLMVVGGPQTRVGSHRSNTLVARDLCARGMTVMRFDYEGLGDSEGAFVGFAQAGPSLEAAIECLSKRLSAPGDIVLWSLCDGSAACALNAAKVGPKVAGMILSNPYVHSAQGKAKAYLKYYYVRRILEGSFWKKMLTFRLNPLEVVSSLANLVGKASGGAPGKVSAAGSAKPADAAAETAPGEDPPQLPEKVMEGLEAYPGPLRLILSGNDLTAKEFLDLYKARGSQARRDKLRWAMAAGGGSASGAAEKELLSAPEADHTFTTAEWKRTLCELTWGAWKDILGRRKP